MRIALVAFVGFALAGCVTEDGLETGSVESAVTILPVAGTWDYGEVSTVSGTCNVKFRQFEDGAFNVDTVTATSFRIVPRDGTAPFTCLTNTAGGFSCPNRAAANLSLRPVIDVSLTMRASATGLFTNNRQVRGKQDLVITCTGAHCGFVGPSPCGYVVNFEAHKL